MSEANSSREFHFCGVKNVIHDFREDSRVFFMHRELIWIVKVRIKTGSKTLPSKKASLRAEG